MGKTKWKWKGGQDKRKEKGGKSETYTSGVRVREGASMIPGPWIWGRTLPRTSRASLWPTGSSQRRAGWPPGPPVAAWEPRAQSLTFSCLRSSSCRWRKYWSLSCCFTSWCLSCRWCSSISHSAASRSAADTAPSEVQMPEPPGPPLHSRARSPHRSWRWRCLLRLCWLSHQLGISSAPQGWEPPEAWYSRRCLECQDVRSQRNQRPRLEPSQKVCSRPHLPPLPNGIPWREEYPWKTLLHSICTAPALP